MSLTLIILSKELTLLDKLYFSRYLLLVLSFNLFNELFKPFSLKRAAKVSIIFKPPNLFAKIFNIFCNFVQKTPKMGQKVEKISIFMVSLWQIFLVFAKIGAFTIGGGIPMIAAIKSELVERKWLKDEDFLDIITLAQTAPGLFAVNISILTGHKLRGTKGSVVATIASCLPPFLIILLVAMFFTNFKDNEYVIRAFKGIRPVVVALIGKPMIDMIRATKMRWWSWVIVAASLILVCLLHYSPIYIIVCVIAMASGISYYNNKKEGRK